MWSRLRGARVFGYIIWGLCVFFYLYELFLRTVIGTFQQQVMADLSLSSLNFSFLSTTSYMLIYGGMQIPVSLIVDRIGLKKSLIIGAVACGVASIGLATSPSFAWAIGFRMLMGFGSSFGFICLLISVYDWMPKKYNGLFIGASQFLGTMGPLMAAGPLHALLQSIDVNWRSVFLVTGAIGFCMMILAWIFVENNHEAKGRYTILKPPEEFMVNVRKMFSSTQPWFIAIFCASIYFSLEYLSENEGIAFLTQKGLSHGFASSAISLTWLGFAIGCPLMGLLSDLIQRRKSIMTFAGLCSVISITAIVYSHSSIVLGFSFFLLGMSASGQIVGVAAMADQFKKHSIAIGYGLNNALVTTTVALNAPLLGFMLDSVKEGTHPSANEYTLVFNFLIAMSLISLIFAVFFVKESFCKSKVDFTYLYVK